MKLIKPEGDLTQPFGVNYNNSYKDSGLKGHSGEDFTLGWKKPIKATVTGEVYSILNEHNPDTTKYRAVFQLVDDGECCYEVSYGHIDTALCKEGQVVEVGQPIATEGNWGTCYYAGSLVTPKEKLKGWGSHLHFQVRPCQKVLKRNPKKQYIRNSEGYVKRNGCFIEVLDYTNGYNGCVDPEQFYLPYQFKNNLKQGDTSAEVMELQKQLQKLGFLSKNVLATGFYGEATVKAVTKFQERYYKDILAPLNLTKGTGYFGDSTRQFLNSLLLK